MDSTNQALISSASWQERVRLRLSTLFWAFNLLFLVPLCMLAVARLVWPDGLQPFVVANLMTRYLYLPAYPIFLVALLRRRREIALMAGVLVALHLLWMAPLLTPPGSNTAPASETLRLFNANVFFGNLETDFILAEIAASDADVLIIQEYAPHWHEAFVAAGIPEAYPHSVLLVRDNAFGSAIYSRRPITDGGEWPTGGLPMIRATVMLDDRPVRLYNIHPYPPTISATRFNPQMAAMVEALRAETEPAVAIGDFNMNRHVHHYRHLLDGGFHSAHVETGRGFVTTWPNGMLRYVPPVQLDHALLSEELLAVHTEEGVGQGSDHLPFIVDVAWR